MPVSVSDQPRSRDGKFAHKALADDPAGAEDRLRLEDDDDGAGASTGWTDGHRWSEFGSPGEGLPPRDTEDAIAQIVANSTGCDTAVRIAQIAVSDDRGDVQGWVVRVHWHSGEFVDDEWKAEHPEYSDHEFIPPEGDSEDCWFDSGLSEYMDPTTYKTWSAGSANRTSAPCRFNARLGEGWDRIRVCPWAGCGANRRVIARSCRGRSPHTRRRCRIRRLRVRA